MSGQCLIYGATGYTGKLTAQAAKAHGLRPILAGRNAAKLRTVAEPLGLAYRAVSLDQPFLLAEVLHDIDVVLHSAGPFSATTRPMVEACLRARTHYLDFSGELATFEEMSALDAAAQERRIMCMPGVGYVVVASDCLAAHVARQLPDAESLQLGLSRTDLASRGSVKTVIELLKTGVQVRRNGRLMTLPVGSLEREFDYGSGKRLSTAFSTGDVCTAFHTTGIPNIEVYLEVNQREWLQSQFSRYGSWLLGSGLGQVWLKTLANMLPEGPSPAARRHVERAIVAEADNGKGTRVRSRLRTPEGYTFSVWTALAIIKRVLHGDYEAGFQTPGRLYGPDFVLQFDGVARKDLEETADTKTVQRGGPLELSTLSAAPSPVFPRHLSPLDAAFLSLESPSTPQHVGYCLIYAGRLSRDEVRQALIERLPFLPRYRQRVVPIPLGLAQPSWQDDPDFDIDNHIEESSLPPPGDDLILSQVAGRVFAAPLEQKRPLWKIILLHGRSDGNTTVVWKIHHAIGDGSTFIDLLIGMHDLQPSQTPAAVPVWRPRPIPGPLSLLVEAGLDQFNSRKRWLTESISQLVQPAELRKRARHLATATLSIAQSAVSAAPRLPFNQPLSAARCFAWAEIPVSILDSLEDQLLSSQEDLLLTIIAGGLGCYLRSQGCPIQDMELRMLYPVSMRSADEYGTLGSKLSVFLAPLYIGITDPRQRLAATQATMAEVKNREQAKGLDTWSTVLDWLPAPMLPWMYQIGIPAGWLNTTVTQVVGPRQPLSLAGHQLLVLIPLAPLIADMGLYTALVSYDQKITISVTVDPNLVPDVWSYIACLKESLAELVSVAQIPDSV